LKFVLPWDGPFGGYKYVMNAAVSTLSQHKFVTPIARMNVTNFKSDNAG
jgi:hypothetical protein